MATSGQDRVWFYYARDAQVGPVKEAELKTALAEGLLSEKDYVYREGFSDWKLLKDVPEFKISGVRSQPIARAPIKPPSSSDKRSGNKRVSIKEHVVAHNDTHVATGLISNISVSGVFFETADSVFSLNDEVKLTLKEGKGLGKPMHLRGVVVRQCRDGLPGYGLELRGLDEASRARIQEYIKRHQAS